MRTSTIKRNTQETKINLTLNLDGKGESKIDTGCGFFDHMLTLFSKHSKIDLDVTCNGDTNVDYHHTVEDIGIVLGKAILEALGDKKGINRYADTILPMDESLILTAIDISGRSYLGFDALTIFEMLFLKDIFLLDDLDFFTNWIKNFLGVGVPFLLEISPL